MTTNPDRRATVVFDLDGTLVTEPPLPLAAIPGARTALRWCRRWGWRVVLYSMNERETVLRRLRTAGLPPAWFDAIVAVGHKDAVTFDRRVAPLARGGRLAVVGNSWRHDVVPALGQADAVVWIQGRSVPGLFGTPANPWVYGVSVIPSVAWVPARLPLALATRSDLRGWRDRAAPRDFPCCAAGAAACPTLGRLPLVRHAIAVTCAADLSDAGSQND